MTDFIVYISAQQQMQVSMHDEAFVEMRRPVSSHRFDRRNLDAVRHRISVALYRLADAVRPFEEPVNAPLSPAR